MESGAVVEGFDVIEDGGAGLGTSSEAMMVDQFVFERGKRGQSLLLTLPQRCGNNRWHAKTAAYRIRRSALSRDEPGRPARSDFLRGGGSDGVFEDLGSGLSQDWMASACLLLDEQSFSSGLGDTTAKSAALDALAAGLLDGLFDRRHRSSGHLFQGRYKSFLGARGRLSAAVAAVAQRIRRTKSNYNPIAAPRLITTMLNV